MRGFIWFREDLRVMDNTALNAATASCHDGVIALFIIDKSMWKKHEMAGCRVQFILRGLQELSASLLKLNIPLFIREINSTENIPRLIHEIVESTKASALFFNKQYEVNESRRDKLVIHYLEQKQVKCFSYDDQTIIAPGKILNGQGQPYKVFTAFKREWYKVYQAVKISSSSIPKKQTLLNFKSESAPDLTNEFPSEVPSSLWKAGEKAAKHKLSTFLKDHLLHYDIERNFPELDSTSHLSPYLSTGMISPRYCFMKALDANQHEYDTGSKGALTWMSELIWRDFYKDVLFWNPRISMHKPYQIHTEKLKWNYDEKKLIAWQQGQTGIPIVDAAMRQLITTGWMHNRLRMIVAMFFAKNLFFDWRLGEKYFTRQLIDCDLSANNGGWQWCASTGTDAAPYFRIFNPITQSQRFDPKGNFIRKFCPELKNFDNKSIHDPYVFAENEAIKIHYPRPIVNIKLSRLKAIEAFKNIR